MGAKGSVLIVDDEESIRYTCRAFLEDEGHLVATAVGYDDAMALISSSVFDVVFLDVILEGRSGLEVLKDLKMRSPDTEAIVVTGVPSIESAAQAMRLGALDYILKPLRQDALLQATAMALAHAAHRQSVDRRRRYVEAIFRCVGDAVVAVDEQFLIVESNGAAESLCGIRCEDARGTLLETWLSRCAGACLQPLRDAVADGSPGRLQRVECRTERRPRQVVDVAATPLTGLDGTRSGGVLVIREGLQG